MSRKRAFVYILKCADKFYYVGSTTQLENRMVQHELGAVDGFTCTRLPFTVVLCLEFSSLYEAITAEKQVKGWSRKKKEALIAGRFDLLHNLASCRNCTHYSNR